MLRNIILNGKTFEYNLTIKNVKNINLRVKKDKTICVSASRRVPIETIERFIVSKADFIINALEKLYSIERCRPKEKEYVSGDKITILSSCKTLLVRESFKNTVLEDENYICICCKDVSNKDLREKTLKKYLYAKLIKIVEDVCKNIYPIFEKFGIEYPQLKFRYMTSRWGSCQYKKGIITFNYALIYVPFPCIEYVAMHEFTHFLQPNHSKKFYNQLTKFMSDWKERKNLLRRYETDVLR